MSFFSFFLNIVVEMSVLQRRTSVLHLCTQQQLNNWNRTRPHCKKGSATYRQCLRPAFSLGWPPTAVSVYLIDLPRPLSVTTAKPRPLHTSIANLDSLCFTGSSLLNLSMINTNCIVDVLRNEGENIIWSNIFIDKMLGNITFFVLYLHW